MIKNLVKLWCIFEAFSEMCWIRMLVVEENVVDDMCFSTCSWMMLTTLYAICIILYPLKQFVLLYLACKHIPCAHFIRCTFCISTYAPASYRIANREPGHSTRGGRGAARGAAQEVTEADEEDVEDLPKCPDHRPSSFERGKPRSIFLLRFGIINYCFTLIDALRIGVVCNRCCITPCLPLLYYILVTLVSTVKSMLSWLRPIEVGWFPVTCEL
jgi:hypothetical protein